MVGLKRDYLWFLWVLGYIVPFKKWVGGKNFWSFPEEVVREEITRRMLGKKPGSGGFEAPRWG